MRLNPAAINLLYNTFEGDLDPKTDESLGKIQELEKEVTDLQEVIATSDQHEIYNVRNRFSNVIREKVLAADQEN